MKIPKVEIPKFGLADRIMNNIIWGKSHFNPNKIDLSPDDEALRPSTSPPKEGEEGKPY